MSYYYRSPLERKGKFATWLNSLRNMSGAYIIRSARNHDILYIGESHTGNLAKTIKRHFWQWRDDPIRAHFTASAFDVEIAVVTTPPGAAKGTQNRLINELKPKDNVHGYDEPPF